MSFCWQTCFYLLYQPALNNAKIKMRRQDNSKSVVPPHLRLKS